MFFLWEEFYMPPHFIVMLTFLKNLHFVNEEAKAEQGTENE
jgi:hypothetical protein